MEKVKTPITSVGSKYKSLIANNAFSTTTTTKNELQPANRIKFNSSSASASLTQYESSIGYPSSILNVNKLQTKEVKQKSVLPSSFKACKNNSFLNNELILRTYLAGEESNQRNKSNDPKGDRIRNNGMGDNPNSKTSNIELAKRRLNSLKQLQFKSAQLEVKFYEDLYLLECKYNKLTRPINEKRKKIINGDYEPTDEESKLSYNPGGNNNPKHEELLREREISRDLIALRLTSNQTTKSLKGIPEFWLNVLKRIGLICQMIEEHDEPILKHLIDIEVELMEKKPFNFKLKFLFSPNEFFHETVLTKTYEFKIEIDPNDPYVFEAPETEKSAGCQISWKKGKNPTRSPLDDTQTQPSFFNFFSTLESESKERESLTCAEETSIALDYEIGYTFKEKVVPRAVLYYMGEIFDDTDLPDMDSDNEDDEPTSVNINNRK